MKDDNDQTATVSAMARLYEGWTEADEVAANIDVDLAQITTAEKADRAAQKHVGTPFDLGRVVFENISEALLRRASEARRAAERAKAREAGQ